MNFKRFLAFLLCALLCLALAACGDDKKDKDDDDDDKSKAPTLEAGDENCDHEFTVWETVKEGDCTKDGKEERKCELCGKEEEKIIVAPGHFDSFGECETCGKKLRKCDHKKVEEVVISVATCTEKGSTHTICKLCDVCVNIDYDFAEGHEYEHHEYQDATCTEDGWYSYSTCTKCDYSDKTVIEAEGHYFVGGTCDRCGTADPEFTSVDIEASAGNPLIIPAISENPYTASTVEFLTYEGEITKKSQKDSYEFTAANAGRYYFELSEVYAGTSMDIYVYDRLGETVNYSTYLGNGDGVYADLKAGEKYTVKVCHRTEYSQYILTIGQAKAVTDITGYTVITDAIEYKEQRVNYTFTATFTGKHYFGFSNMIADTDVRLYVYNYLGETVNYGTYLHNNDGVSVTLNAGETYSVEVQYQNGTPGYNLTVGYPQATSDISSYTAVYHNFYFSSQENYYTYTPKASGNVVFYLDNVPDEFNVGISLFNSLNERLSYNSYCSTGDYISYELVAGETYTIKVTQQDGYPQNYGVVIGNNKAPYDASGKVAINDSFEFDEQAATYNYTVSADGDLYLTFKGYNNGYVRIQVYNENGVSIYEDSYIYNGNTATLYGMKSGEKITVVITGRDGAGDYTIAFG